MSNMDVEDEDDLMQRRFIESVALAAYSLAVIATVSVLMLLRLFLG